MSSILASSGANSLSTSSSASKFTSHNSESNDFRPRASHAPKENLRNFLTKKRDMFLLNLSIQLKKNEIDKFDQKAQMKENALKKAEQMLAEDAMKFDAFLKENDRKAAESLKKAEVENKEKIEKMNELKKINSEMAKMENEMKKLEENVKNCLKYKVFLDSLTPNEWKEDENNTNEDSERMYFQSPEQLLNIFSSLEERNLFLIQNVQQNEEELEEWRAKFGRSETEMSEQKEKIEENMRQLSNTQTPHNNNNNKSVTMESQNDANQKYHNEKNCENELKLLHDKISYIYHTCGIESEGFVNGGCLEMLKEMENWVEKLLYLRSQMDPKAIEAAEKKKSVERRAIIRQAKKEEQQRLYEERLAKSAARANAEVVKRQGKPVMYRSPPIQKVKKKEKVAVVNEEEEEWKTYFT